MQFYLTCYQISCTVLYLMSMFTNTLQFSMASGIKRWQQSWPGTELWTCVASLTTISLPTAIVRWLTEASRVRKLGMHKNIDNLFTTVGNPSFWWVFTYSFHTLLHSLNFISSCHIHYDSTVFSLLYCLLCLLPFTTVRNLNIAWILRFIRINLVLWLSHKSAIYNTYPSSQLPLIIKERFW